MTSRLSHELRLFFIAMQFLTRVPSPRWVGFAADDLNGSARYFPLVGLLVGAVASLVLWIAGMLFPPMVAVGLSMASAAVLTGGFHEDGLADTFDALGGAVTRERALAIMKDSRIGTYGALALLVVLGIKAAALTAMPVAMAVPALLLGHTASRAAAVFLIRVLPYAGDVEHAKAKPLARQISVGGVSIAIVWVVLVAVILAVDVAGHAPWITVSLALVIAGTLWMRRWLRRRLGGYTGDTLGATQQITELLSMLGWLAASRCMN
jgi:adenosylcobinamide-GDP ribazoletransferase